MGSKVYLILLVVLGVAGSAFSGGCPDKEAVFPCSCYGYEGVKDLKVYCMEDVSTLKELKKALTAFDKQYTLSLVLNSLDVGTLPADFFEGLNIRILELVRFNVKQLSDEEGRVLVGLENSLEVFTVINSISGKNWPAVLDLSHLKKLVELRLSDNRIIELSGDWWKKIPTSLTTLVMNSIGIEKLGSNAFANFPKLQRLSLEGNDFGEMKRSMLPNPATHLESMSLQFNGFFAFPDDFFSEMPALRYLILFNNEFSVIPELPFKYIWMQLKLLEIGFNPLNCEDSVLKWMLKESSTPKINGKCATPPERKDKEIWDVIKEIKGRNRRLLGNTCTNVFPKD